MNGSKLLIDTSVLLAWFHKEPQYIRVRKLLLKAQRGQTLLSASEITLMELLYVLIRDFGQSEAQKSLTTIENLPIKFIPITRNILVLAASYKSKGKISVADTIIAATAKEKDLPLLTKDPEFLVLKKEIKVEIL